MSAVFRFKQFEVSQARSAMKVGTDSVILGAWTHLSPGIGSILDVGAGTGILSLMMAQRSGAEILDAIEIEEEAYNECVENFENSPWSDRLFCYHGDVGELAGEIDEKYDLIISNPPFFTSARHTSSEFKNSARNLARSQQQLSFSKLLENVSVLLDRKGLFSTVIPFTSESNFISLASDYGLHPKRILRIKGNPTSKITRSCMELTFTKGPIPHSSLIIELDRHQYTHEYQNLTKDFYLKM